MGFQKNPENKRGTIMNGVKRFPLACPMVCSSTSQHDDGVHSSVPRSLLFFLRSVPKLRSRVRSPLGGGTAVKQAVFVHGARYCSSVKTSPLFSHACFIFAVFECFLFCVYVLSQPFDPDVGAIRNKDTGGISRRKTIIVGYLYLCVPEKVTLSFVWLHLFCMLCFFDRLARSR